MIIFFVVFDFGCRTIRVTVVWGHIRATLAVVNESCPNSPLTPNGIVRKTPLFL